MIRLRDRIRDLFTQLSPLRLQLLPKIFPAPGPGLNLTLSNRNILFNGEVWYRDPSDSTNSIPIPGATVDIGGTVSLTKDDGGYAIYKRIPLGPTPISITVSAPGFYTQTKDITVPAGHPGLDQNSAYSPDNVLINGISRNEFEMIPHRIKGPSPS